MSRERADQRLAGAVMKKVPQIRQGSGIVPPTL
jgi:hypothetical protein